MKVLVGMSGGVDSSVAAALLKDRGHEVVGVTMHLYEGECEGGCCSMSAVDDARAVANKLGIDHYVMNFKDIFNETVIKDFKEAYINAKTPNPCLVCNQKVKFGSLLDKALAMGFDAVATGHYADIVKSGDRYLLKKSLGGKKDQTYFLSSLTQEQLKHSLFPLSALTKDEVRKIAEEKGLRVAHKGESQEICFVLDNEYRNFLRENNVTTPSGDIVFKDKPIGRHEGISNYTIGQRRGLGIAWETPLYVTLLDKETNTVRVGQNDELFRTSLIADKLNWISIDKLKEAMRVTAKIRYGAKEAAAVIEPIGSMVKVSFDEPQRAITPGQQVVFYDGDFVVGGGIIE